MNKFMFRIPTEIHFGGGMVDSLGEKVKLFGENCLLVTTPKDEPALSPLYTRVISIMEKSGIAVTHFDEVVPNPTVQSIEKAISIVKEKGITTIVAVGGGSSMDTAKAISVFHGIEKIDWNHMYDNFTSPFEDYESHCEPMTLITVPTTAGTGSELTQAMIISDETTEDKMCIFHQNAFPTMALVDYELTATMPARLTAMTAFDAFCHAFESYVRKEASPMTRLIGEESMATIIDTLPKLVKNLDNKEYREAMSLAAMYSGISLANAAATVPHPLSEIIGGIAPRIPHGQALACLYPSFIAFQKTKTLKEVATLARMLDKSLSAVSDEEAADKASGLIAEFLNEIGIGQGLTELGITAEEKEKMCNHFLLGVLPFGTKEELTAVMEGAF